MTSLQDLTLDLEECEKLLRTATRSRILSLLEKEKTTLKTAIDSALGPMNKNVADTNQSSTAASSSNSSTGKHYKPIKSFAWDGSSAKTAKIYVNLKGIGKHDASNISSNFESRSVEIKVDNFNGSNYVFTTTGLAADIVPEQCSFKAKDDEIVVTLKKKMEKAWKHLKKSDQDEDDKKKKKEAEEKKANEDDPSASIMNMMKKMYDEGDDDMKRTIAKAWTESRDKQSRGDSDMPTMPDL